MYEVFTKLLNMSLTASILVLIIMVLRVVLKKAPKKYICILWFLVAFRLICPFSISSSFSVYNVLQSNTVSNGQIEYFEYNGKTEKPQLTFELPALTKDDFSSDNRTVGTKTLGIYMPAVAYIWVFGVIAMAAYALISYSTVRKKIRASIKRNDNIYVCDEINSPFILGIIRPRIYLPSGITEEVRENVIAHEKAHIRRHDFIWKPLGFALLSVYWINPVMWVAYIFLCRDIEAACDEKVISKMDRAHIAGYSQALLVCATQRRMITACPIAFGETDVKGRIRNVLSYKKPAFWIICISVLICIVVAVCFLTNPEKDKGNGEVVFGTYAKNDSMENPMFSWSGLTINEDGTFTFSPSVISSYMGAGTWTVEGDYVTFNDIGMGDNRKEVFRYGDGKLYYEADKSASDSMWGLDDGAEYVLQTEDAPGYPVSLISNNGYYWLSAEREEFWDKKYEKAKDDVLPCFAIRNIDYKSLAEVDYMFTKVPERYRSDLDSKRNTEKGNAVSYGEYTDELVFNFGGKFFSSDDYKEPAHGDGAPEGWYALGGEGVFCNDPYFSERETFLDGKLIAYNYLDNHSDYKKIKLFSTGGFSCCMYQYSFDLFTAAELEKNPNADPTSEYWVVFYTEGEDKPLYMKYFNCDYFSQEQAVENILTDRFPIIMWTNTEEENLGVFYEENPITHEYTVDKDTVFKYKKTLIGKEPKSEYSVQYIVLTNDEDITWEEVNNCLYGSDSNDLSYGTVIIGMNTVLE